MNKITSPLNPQKHGETVADLQDGLRLLLDKGRIRLSDADWQTLDERLRAERAESKYGEATQKLVGLFREQHQLQPGGEVDEPTAEALNEVLEELGAFCQATPGQPRLVGGQVRRADKQPFPGTLVRAFHADEHSSLRLGEDTTDPEGRYTIRYAPLSCVEAVHLRVTVFDAEGNLSHESEVVRILDPVERTSNKAEFRIQCSSG